MLLQGATDNTGCFIDVELGYRGKNHDTFLFKRSALCGDIGPFVPGNPATTICGVRVPPLITAGAAYPVREWLIKPYGGHLDDRKVHFDNCLSTARNVVECNFGHLKQH